jgi:hypothetical protein
MGWFSRSKTWELGTAGHPWQGAASIYEHIKKHLLPDGRLDTGGERLPDEKDDGGIKWVAGGLDGAFGHHAGGGSEKDRAKMLYRALSVALDDAAPAKLKKLYDHLLDGSVLDFIDPVLELIIEKQDLDAGRLHELALWLAEKSPDRGPVKFAIALFGVIPGSDHSDLLLTLGKHEEFTLYVAVALSNREGDVAEGKLFELAKSVEGWGRISIVERLAKTGDSTIKAWMLREGYRNRIMNEYLAYTCASAGGLRRELESESVDQPLLRGAGDIIRALITGGPAQNIDDYADGAVVVERYLEHLGGDPKELTHLLVVNHIDRFLGEEADWSAREKRGWTLAVRTALRKKTAAVKCLPHWQELIAAGLTSQDRVTFYEADEAAKALGIDSWNQHFSRLETGADDGWFFVMRTDDPGRIDRVVALAEKRIPLDEIATGPAEEMGLGPAWANHGHLDFVLQDLRRFPGKGWSLIRAGIRSPVIRNRHMALRALSPWGIERWPSGAEGVLRATLADEPDKDVREEIELLLAGKQIEEPRLEVS